VVAGSVGHVGCLIVDVHSMFADNVKKGVLLNISNMNTYEAMQSVTERGPVLHGATTMSHTSETSVMIHLTAIK